MTDICEKLHTGDRRMTVHPILGDDICWLLRHAHSDPCDALLTDCAADEIEACRAENERLSAVLTATTKWLEENQEDVFRRGIWDAIVSSDSEES